MSASSPQKLLLAAVVVPALLVFGACGAEEDQASEAPSTTTTATAGRAATPGGRTVGDAGTAESTGGVEQRVDGCARREKVGKGEEVRIGDFAPPEGVPPYEVLEEEPVRRDCVRALRLLVDTRAEDEAGYELIARDLKARYGELDAVTVRFTDTSGAFTYRGSALIFNTPPGSQFMGHVYGPPNNEGYIIDVAD